MHPLPILLFASAALLGAAEATPGPRDVRTHLRAQLEQGNGSVRLDVAGLPFGPVTLEGAREAKGQFSGKARFGRSTVRALFHYAQQPGTPKGAWILAFKVPVKRLSDLTPTCRATIVDQLDLSSAILAFSLGDVNLDARDLGPGVRAFYGAYASRTLEFATGVNVAAAARPRPGTTLAKALGLVGLGALQVNLRGVVLKGFKLGELKEARDKGQLQQALQRSTELRASLPHFRPPGLPKAFKTSSAYLSVTGEPGVGVGFSMTLGRGRSQKTFDCELNVRKIQLPQGKTKPTKKRGADLPIEATEVTIVAGCTGRWSNALGIKGFHLNEVRLLLSVDSAKQVSFGLRAALQIGRTKVMLAGKVRLHSVTGAATGGVFAFKVGSLSSADLIAFANAVSRPPPRGMKAGRAKPLDHGKLPGFRLVDVEGRFAPLGGEPDLGIPSGIALKGKLFAFKRQLLAVDATLDQTSFIPTLRVWGRSAKINLGPVGLDRASVDIKIGPTLNPYFRAKGGSRLLGAEKRLDIDISRKAFRFELYDKLAGVYEAHWKASSPSQGKPSWDLEVLLKNHFHKTLEKKVSAKALAWANKTKAGFDKAERNLAKAQASLSALDRKIDAARAEVRAKRAEHQANYARSIAKVKRLDGEIAARRAVVKKKRAPLRKLAAHCKRRMDDAVDAWEKAVKKRKKAKGLKKAAARAAEVKAYGRKVRLTAEYRAASGKLSKALQKADAKLAALHTAKGTALSVLHTAKAAHALSTKTPVDSDPRVANLFVQRGTAEGALITARATVRTTGNVVAGALKVTAWAAKHHGFVFKLHQAGFSTRLAKYLKGSQIKLHVKVSTLGRKPKTLALVVSLDDLRRGHVFGQLWKLLKPGLKAAAKANKKAKRGK